MPKSFKHLKKPNGCCFLAFSIPIAFRSTKMAPRWPKMAPRGPKRAPRLPQERPVMTSQCAGPDNDDD
eukprot:6411585-Pyramimonas_sp.AAC.1